MGEREEWIRGGGEVCLQNVGNQKEDELVSIDRVKTGNEGKRRGGREENSVG